MTIPPVHNFIVQWAKENGTYLNIFDTDKPHFYSLNSNEENRIPIRFVNTSYEEYITKMHNSNVHLYIPTTVTTIEEARQLHPEFFI